MTTCVNPEYTEEQAAYHEAGHAVASYLADVAFVLVTIDCDPRTGNKPGVLWPDRKRPPKEDRQACCRYYSDEIAIDLGGRIAESLVTDPPFPLPQVNEDFLLLPIRGDLANDDMQRAWGNIRQSDYYCFGARNRPSSEWNQKFASAYDEAKQRLLLPENRRRIEALANALLAHRELSKSLCVKHISRDPDA